jgi:hypothetical protein
MRSRARLAGEPETLRARFSAAWSQDVVRPNASLEELYPKSRAFIVREERGGRVVDVMSCGALGGQGPWPMTNIRNLRSPQLTTFASAPSRRCPVPLTEPCGRPTSTRWAGASRSKVRCGSPSLSSRSSPSLGFGSRPSKARAYHGHLRPERLGRADPPKAMIAILHEEDWDRWLRGSYDDVVALQRPYPTNRMTVRGPVFPTRREGNA